MSSVTRGHLPHVFDLRGILALIIYECMIITGQEAQYFWTERITGAAVLFYLNKYLTLLSFVYTTIGFILGMSDQVRRSVSMHEPTMVSSPCVSEVSQLSAA